MYISGNDRFRQISVHILYVYLVLFLPLTIPKQMLYLYISAVMTAGQKFNISIHGNYREDHSGLFPPPSSSIETCETVACPYHG
jgi:hypothetical protein